MLHFMSTVYMYRAAQIEIILSLSIYQEILMLVYNNLQLQKSVFELRAKRNQHSSPLGTEGRNETDSATAEKGLKLPPLVAPPQDTSNPFPLVTSRDIGWRSARKYNLEVFGRWARPKYSILNQLKWPRDAVP